MFLAAFGRYHHSQHQPQSFYTDDVIKCFEKVSKQRDVIRTPENRDLDPNGRASDGELVDSDEEPQTVESVLSGSISLAQQRILQHIVCFSKIAQTLKTERDVNKLSIQDINKWLNSIQSLHHCALMVFDKTKGKTLYDRSCPPPKEINALIKQFIPIPQTLENEFRSGQDSNWEEECKQVLGIFSHDHTDPNTYGQEVIGNTKKLIHWVHRRLTLRKDITDETTSQLLNSARVTRP